MANTKQGTPIAILGAGGLGRDMAWLIEDINRVSPRWQIAGFIDPTLKPGERIGRYKVLGGDAWLFGQETVRHLTIGIGDPAIRRELFEKFKQAGGFEFPNLVHPDVGGDRETISLGEGNQICSRAILTHDLRIGDNNNINHLVTVGHDVRIGNHCVINTAANLSGKVQVGDECLLGARCVTREGITIAPGTLVGMGACVIQDIQDPGTYFGNPARKMAEKQKVSL